MTLTLLLDGSETPYLNKPDNMAIDEHGHLLIQEDPGNNDHLARIVAYRIEDGARGVVAEFDPERFTAGGPEFMTLDEESSGIIDVGGQLRPEGLPLRRAGAHGNRAVQPDHQVQHGQLLLLRVKSWGQIFRNQP